MEYDTTNTMTVSTCIETQVDSIVNASEMYFAAPRY